MYQRSRANADLRASTDPGAHFDSRANSNTFAHADLYTFSDPFANTGTDAYANLYAYTCSFPNTHLHPRTDPGAHIGPRAAGRYPDT